MTFRQAMADARVVPVLRTPANGSPLAAVSVLVDEGFTVVELTLTSPDPFGELAAAVAAHPSATIGMGSVTTAADVVEAAARGAAYVVSPVVAPDVIAEARRQRIAVVAGAMTATETWRARELGADLVKLFPAGRLGVGYVRDLLGPFPHLQLMVTGGIRIADVHGFLDAGAIAVGLGGDLLGDACTPGGDLQGLGARCQRLREALT